MDQGNQLESRCRRTSWAVLTRPTRNAWGQPMPPLARSSRPRRTKSQRSRSSRRSSSPRGLICLRQVCDAGSAKVAPAGAGAQPYRGIAQAGNAGATDPQRLERLLQRVQVGLRHARLGVAHHAGQVPETDRLLPRALRRVLLGAHLPVRRPCSSRTFAPHRLGRAELPREREGVRERRGRRSVPLCSPRVRHVWAQMVDEQKFWLKELMEPALLVRTGAATVDHAVTGEAPVAGEARHVAAPRDRSRSRRRAPPAPKRAARDRTFVHSVMDGKYASNGRGLARCDDYQDGEMQVRLPLQESPPMFETPLAGPRRPDQQEARGSSRLASAPGQVPERCFQWPGEGEQTLPLLIHFRRR